MKAYIHSFRGTPWNAECLAAYNGFQRLGVECVLFSSDEELNQWTKSDIVVAGMIVMGHFLSMLDIAPPNYNYPDELTKFLHRNIRQICLKDLEKQHLPVFIKPLEEKAAQGMIIEHISELGEYEGMVPETLLLCSDVLDLVSEWRCFIRYGRIVGIQHYKGNAEIQCDLEIIHDAVNRCRNLPAGCSLDFGVTTDGRTCLIEMNDGYSIGCYGLDDIEYAKLLYARWAELVGVKDIFQ